MKPQEAKKLMEIITGYLTTRDVYLQERALEDLVAETRAENVIFIASTMLAHPNACMGFFSLYAEQVARPGYHELADIIRELLVNTSDTCVIEDFNMALQKIAACSSGSFIKDQ